MNASSTTVSFEITVVWEVVVEVDLEPLFLDEVVEGIVHIALECSGCVAHPEEYNSWFVGALFSGKGSFPFISFLDSNVVESPVDIDFSEYTRTLEIIDNSFDGREGILVFHHP
jgi:hypothetical protein